METPKTTFYLCEKKGKGYSVTGRFTRDGTMRYENLSLEPMKKSFGKLKKELSIKTNIVIMPYVCDLVVGGEIYQVVFSNPEKDVRAILKSRPLDIAGTFIPNKTWITELTPEDMSRVAYD